MSRVDSGCILWATASKDFLAKKKKPGFTGDHSKLIIPAIIPVTGLLPKVQIDLFMLASTIVKEIPGLLVLCRQDIVYRVLCGLRCRGCPVDVATRRK